MIIPAVMLLKIDHWANDATPTTANTDEINSKICSLFTPQMMTMDISAKIPNSKLMYLITKIVLCSNISFKQAYIRTILLLTTLKIMYKKTTYNVAISSCK